MKPRLVTAFLATVLLVGFSLAADSGVAPIEKILSFHADIGVLADSTLEVRETIQVLAAGERIKRGIFRDFPTSYQGSDGRVVEVEFALAEVLRDGEEESSSVEGIADGVRVRIGKKEVFLNPGVYTYTIVYRTGGQLGFFDDHDELYWNVTGNGWEFPIDIASATIRLPDGVPRDRFALEAYTGPAGAKGTDYQASIGPGGTADFLAVKPLAAGEGLTVVVSFPKGHVTPPPPPSGAELLFRQLGGAVAGAAGLVVLLLYYLIAWSRVGRDPEKGPLVPRYEPPAGLSPAAARYLTRMGLDQKTFAAALIAMAVKGHLTIGEADGEYTLTKGAGTAPLEPEEKAAAERLFAGVGAVPLVQSNHKVVGEALSALRGSLRRRMEKVHFVTNRRYLVPGVLISLLAVVGGIVTHRPSRVAEAGFMLLWLSIWSLGVAVLLTRVVQLWRAALSGRGRLSGSITQAVFATLFALPFVLGELVGLALFGHLLSPAMAVIFAAVAGTNLLFHRLLAAPTRAGRTLIDAIDGFREFLSAVEGDRLDTLYPAGRTPELFERYLPWALALDVEQRWTERFSEVLARAGAEPGGYSPTWYQGGTISSLGATAFASALGSSLTAAVASSSTPPGSSSGSGGGGSSGGGGGGGGGGGW
jgi:hypothetical protein